jgi:hypothetical protein
MLEKCPRGAGTVLPIDLDGAVCLGPLLASIAYMYSLVQVVVESNQFHILGRFHSCVFQHYDTRRN